jgi:hypothetical protein
MTKKPPGKKETAPGTEPKANERMALEIVSTTYLPTYLPIYLSTYLPIYLCSWLRSTCK